MSITLNSAVTGSNVVSLVSLQRLCRMKQPDVSLSSTAHSLTHSSKSQVELSQAEPSQATVSHISTKRAFSTDELNYIPKSLCHHPKTQSKPRDAFYKNETTVQLTSTVSGSKNLWKEAYANLTRDKDRNLLDADAVVDLDQVMEDVKRRMEICRAKQWAIQSSRGNNIIIRDVFAKIATWIDKFKQVGHVVIQYDPGHAALRHVDRETTR